MTRGMSAAFGEGGDEERGRRARLKNMSRWTLLRSGRTFGTLPAVESVVGRWCEIGDDAADGGAGSVCALRREEETP